MFAPKKKNERSAGFRKPNKKIFNPSPSDNRKLWVSTPSERAKPAGEASLIFGIRPVIEAIRSGKEIEKIYFQQGAGSALMAELSDEIRKYKIPFQFVPSEKLNHMMKSKNHQGVIAQLSPVTYRDIEDIIPTIFEKGETPLVIILDRITDVRNFGAISRSAECAGAHALIIPSKGSAQINGDAIKTSAGALYQIPVCRSENLKQTCDFLKKSGLRIIACTEKTDNRIQG